MDGWYPGAVKLPITTGEFFPTRSVATIGIVDHVTAGADSRDWLQHADNQSSVHFLIRQEDGKGVVYQFMPIQQAAWANGTHSDPATTPGMPFWVKSLIARGININMATISIEHERVWPYSTPWPKEQIDASIALHKWLVANVPTLRVDREHIIGHYQIDNVRRPFCPGGPGGKLFPFDAIIAAVKGTPPVPTPEPEPQPEDNRTAIERFHDESGGFDQYGNPCEVDNAGRVKERTIVLSDVGGSGFQVAFYQKGVIVWREDKGASRYNSGTWLLDELVKHGEI